MLVARKNLNPFEIKKYKEEFLDEYYKKYNIAKNFVLANNIKTIWSSHEYHSPKGEAYDFEKERYNSSFGKEHWEHMSGLCGIYAQYGDLPAISMPSSPCRSF